MPVRGVIFDLDGTLIDSRLDFDAMRRAMGFAPGRPILESIDELPPGLERERCLQILHAHERAGALAATLIPGAQALLSELSARGLPQAILTRNSRGMTALALDRLELSFSQVLTRDDGPPKPDPAGLHRICRRWNFNPVDVMFVGDFHFDLLAGLAAGIRTVLFAPDGPPAYAGDAYAVVDKLSQIVGIVESLG